MGFWVGDGFGILEHPEAIAAGAGEEVVCINLSQLLEAIALLHPNKQKAIAHLAKAI